VYVLCVGTAPRTEDVGATYTLQVRVQQQGAASDIAKVRAGGCVTTNHTSSSQLVHKQVAATHALGPPFS
jgi:hypothetical protein